MVLYQFNFHQQNCEFKVNHVVVLNCHVWSPIESYPLKTFRSHTMIAALFCFLCRARTEYFFFTYF